MPRHELPLFDSTFQSLFCQEKPKQYTFLRNGKRRGMAVRYQLVLACFHLISNRQLLNCPLVSIAERPCTLCQAYPVRRWFGQSEPCIALEYSATRNPPPRWVGPSSGHEGGRVSSNAFAPYPPRSILEAYRSACLGRRLAKTLRRTHM